MAWDDVKIAGSTLTAAEWNTHVTDQKGHQHRHSSAGTDPIQATLDGRAIALTTQGQIVYASAANTLSALAPGTAGYPLLTGGAAANPSWAKVDHGGGVTGLTDDDHTQYLKEEGSGGVASEVPDHTHQNAGECGQLDHGLALTGLGDDDHTIYLKAAGARNWTIPTPSDHAAEGIIVSATAGQNVGTGDVCYLKSDGKFWLGDADAEATTKGLMALATAGIAAEATGNFLLYGKFRDDTWNWTVAGELYVHTVPGNPTQTRPSASGDVVRIVGHAYTVDILFFAPSQTYIELA